MIISKNGDNKSVKNSYFGADFQQNSGRSFYNDADHFPILKLKVKDHWMKVHPSLTEVRSHELHIRGLLHYMSVFTFSMYYLDGNIVTSYLQWKNALHFWWFWVFCKNVPLRKCSIIMLKPFPQKMVRDMIFKI